MPASASAVLDSPVEEAVLPARRPRPTTAKPRRQPRYHVILWNDDDHTYDYVIAMLRTLFGHPEATAFTMAEEVDVRGRGIVLTTTKEHAELKRDQIHAFGADRLIARSRGSMWASIEPEPA
ncbi:MAG: ATP-dependent Clp protease adaptor ClpS [Planctomycetia bacterium]